MTREIPRNAELKKIARGGMYSEIAGRRKVILSLSARWNYVTMNRKTFNAFIEANIIEGFVIKEGSSRHGESSRYLMRLTPTGRAIQEVYYHDLALKLERAVKKVKAEQCAQKP